MEGRPPGWYKDPDGVATNEAWWDGEKWIASVRDPVTGKVKNPDAKPLSQKKVVWIAIGFSLGVIALYAFLVGF